ncbi:hypothetical protein TNCV_4659231 [Trichonephila clavipes]|nr:hypothetical protein TNCV_4659231 [Trichonephila clavipes]
MRLLNQSRQNDHLRVMLVQVHIAITSPHAPLPVFWRIGGRTIPYSWRALLPKDWRHFEELTMATTALSIVRVQYFVRGGFVGYRSRASSKHLSPPLPVDELHSSGGQKGVALHLQMHVWVSGPQRKPTRC